MCFVGSLGRTDRDRSPRQSVRHRACTCGEGAGVCHTGDRVRVCGAGVAGAWGSVQAQGRLEPAGTLQGLSAKQLQCLTPPALSGCWRVTAGAGAAPAVATAVPHLPWLLGGMAGQHRGCATTVGCGLLFPGRHLDHGGTWTHSARPVGLCGGGHTLSSHCKEHIECGDSAQPGHSRTWPSTLGCLGGA